MSRKSEENDKSKEKRTGGSGIISSILIVCGVLLIVTPLAITHINKMREDDIIDEFLKEVEIPAVQSREDTEEYSGSGGIDAGFTEELSSPASTYTPVPGQTPESTPEPTPDATPEAPAPTKKPAMSKEEIQKRMTGVLIIEKIDVRMVIMDGTDDEALKVAAGRMTETGNFDEVGNCVLAGHRSYTFGKKFNRLDELQPGDEIIVQTKDKMLRYEVYKKHIVEPDDLSITKGDGENKILTLFTCHPVMVASHRLVVHAKQIDIAK